MLNANDLENDRAADEQAEYDERLEQAQQALSDDLYEAYFDDNLAAVEEINEALTEQDGLYDRLRTNFTNDGLALRSAYSKAVAIACDLVATRMDSLKQIERVRREWDV